MTVEFVGREDLLITTLREFLEILILSIKKNQNFHSEIFNAENTHIGLALAYD